MSKATNRTLLINQKQTVVKKADLSEVLPAVFKDSRPTFSEGLSDTVVGCWYSSRATGRTPANVYTDIVLLEQETGTYHDSILYFSAPGQYNYSDVKYFRDQGRSVMYNLDISESGWPKTSPNLQYIVNGDFDARVLSFIAAMNADIREDRTELYIEFLHEFDGSSYAWATGVPGQIKSNFVLAWRRLANLFRDNCNVPYKLCQRYDSSFTNGVGLSEVDDPAQLYPGDEFVDMVGMTAYMRTGREYDQNIDMSIYQSKYNIFAAICDKPLYIGETGVNDNGTLGSRNILNGGTGYTNNSVITFPAPPPGGRQAYGAIIKTSGGVVTSIDWPQGTNASGFISDRGAGYPLGSVTPLSIAGGGTGANLNIRSSYVDKPQKLRKIAEVVKAKMPRIKLLNFFNERQWYPSLPEEKVAYRDAHLQLKSLHSQPPTEALVNSNQALATDDIANWSVTGANPGSISIVTNEKNVYFDSTQALEWNLLGSQPQSNRNVISQVFPQGSLRSLQMATVSFWAWSDVEEQTIEVMASKPSAATFEEDFRLVKINTSPRFYEVPICHYFFGTQLQYGFREHPHCQTGKIWIQDFKVEKGTVATRGPKLPNFISASGDNEFTGVNTFQSIPARSSFNLKSGTAPTAPDAGDAWQDAGDRSLETFVGNTRQLIATALRDQTYTVRSTVANTVAQSNLTAWSVPANFFSTGKHLQLINTGRYSTAGTPTIQFDLTFGATTFATTGAVTLVTASNFMYKLETIFQLNGAPGTSSAMTSAGTLTLFDSATGAARVLPFFTNGSLSIDTTILNEIALKATWGTASASNSINSRISTQISC